MYLFIVHVYLQMYAYVCTCIAQRKFLVHGTKKHVNVCAIILSWLDPLVCVYYYTRFDYIFCFLLANSKLGYFCEDSSRIFRKTNVFSGLLWKY